MTPLHYTAHARHHTPTIHTAARWHTTITPTLNQHPLVFPTSLYLLLLVCFYINWRCFFLYNNNNNNNNNINPTATTLSYNLPSLQHLPSLTLLFVTEPLNFWPFVFHPHTHIHKHKHTTLDAYHTTITIASNYVSSFPLRGLFLGSLLPFLELFCAWNFDLLRSPNTTTICHPLMQQRNERNENNSLNETNRKRITTTTTHKTNPKQTKPTKPNETNETKRTTKLFTQNKTNRKRNENKTSRQWLSCHQNLWNFALEWPSWGGRCTPCAL